jgi:glutathione S-transferase
MGAWGTDTFENDTALDWANDLASRGWPHVEDTLARALSVGAKYLDADLACEALAAADTVARALGSRGQVDAYTEAIDAWVAAQRSRPNASLVARARAAVERVLGPNSELAELWADSDDADDWTAVVGKLRARLA